MTTEDKLKELILTRYQSIREFTIVTEIAYSTFDTIMRRGIRHANISNVLKICSVLHIIKHLFVFCKGEDMVLLWHTAIFGRV